MSSLRANVIEVTAGPKGYAMTTISEGNETGKTATFSLSCWEGSNPPRKGQIVLLNDVSMFEKGWRAASAKPITPENPEKQENPENTK